MTINNESYASQAARPETSGLIPRDELSQGIGVAMLHEKISPELGETAAAVRQAISEKSGAGYQDDRHKDAQAVLWHLNRAAGKTPDFPNPHGEPPKPLTEAARSAALVASIAAAKAGAGVLLIETGEQPVAPLGDPGKLGELARQPGVVGAAAIHDTLHPGSPN